MNSVNLIGRLTADPDYKTTSEGHRVARFSIAIDRMLSQERKESLEVEGKQTADFPRIVVWGNQAERVNTYLKKGDQVGVVGSVTTGSYTKDDGTKVYTTDIRAGRVRFLNKFNKGDREAEKDMVSEDIENVPF